MFTKDSQSLDLVLSQNTHNSSMLGTSAVRSIVLGNKVEKTLNPVFACSRLKVHENRTNICGKTLVHSKIPYNNIILSSEPMRLNWTHCNIHKSADAVLSQSLLHVSLPLQSLRSILITNIHKSVPCRCCVISIATKSSFAILASLFSSLIFKWRLQRAVWQTLMSYPLHLNVFLFYIVYCLVVHIVIDGNCINLQCNLLNLIVTVVQWSDCKTCNYKVLGSNPQSYMYM